MRLWLFGIGLGSLLSVAALASDYQKILECDGGAAVVDVSKAERRNLQLVIRSDDILRYLHSVGAVYLRYGDKEAILPGRVQSGVFYAQDFRGFDKSDYASSPTYYVVHPDGSGLKVSFRKLRLGTGVYYCDGHYEARHGGTYPGEYCDGVMKGVSPPWRFIPHQYDEFANWYFQDCQSTI